MELQLVAKLPPAAGPPDAMLQQKLHEKLTQVGVDGQPTHGTLMETFAPPQGDPVIVFTDSNRFVCGCCPPCSWRQDGTFAADTGFTNVYAHMGSKAHYMNFRRAFDLSAVPVGPAGGVL